MFDKVGRGPADEEQPGDVLFGMFGSCPLYMFFRCSKLPTHITYVMPSMMSNDKNDLKHHMSRRS
jgi:hypothetical protein